MTRPDEQRHQRATAQTADDLRDVRSEVLLMWVFTGAGALLTLASALLT